MHPWLRTERVSLLLASCLGCTSEAAFTSIPEDGTAVPPQAIGGAAGSSGVEPHGPRGTFSLTFEEDCEGPLDPAIWQTQMYVGDSAFREWGQRADYMADEQVRIENGLCTITAEDRPTSDSSYTSGVLNTAHGFSQRFGVFEARMSVPVDAGLWPIWWLRDIDGWPPAINIFNLQADPTEAPSVGYWWASDGVNQNESASLPPLDWTQFHVFGAEWTADEIVFYIDGVETARHSAGVQAISDALYLTLNLSVGDGTDAPLPDETTSWPAVMSIDWVRVFQRIE